VIEQRVSLERLGAYRAVAGGDLDRAVDLYEWNAAVSGAFFEVLGHLEVILRNALNEQLTVWHAATGRPGGWYDDPAGILDEHRHEEIATARERLLKARKSETAGRIVAELNFGFWRFLLDKRYQPILWAQALRHAFPNLTPADRRAVYGPVVRLNEFRNRIAHHEPIHRLDLTRLHQEALGIVDLIDHDVASWLSGLSRVPALSSARPS
jgi:hypothetical protein